MLCPCCGAQNDEAAQVCFHCRVLLSAITRGTVLAERYEILSPLGRGGMGAVYRARDRVLDEEVAVKVLRADASGTEESALRFRSEIKLARRVSHWNVCRIHEYGEDGPLRFISMELVEGETLKEVLRRRGPLTAAEGFDVAIQVTEGLAAVHQAGVIHRDLKSANIMLDRAGRSRVMDFGIAKREMEAGSAASGYVVGSPEYMSPEQARGVPVDTRSDLYALGVVIFEAFTGEVPFHADTPVGTLLLHLEASPPIDVAAIPPALRPVLRRALSKEPSERFASALAMADALRAARGAGRRRCRGRTRARVPPRVRAMAGGGAPRADRGWRLPHADRRTPSTVRSETSDCGHAPADTRDHPGDADARADVGSRRARQGFSPPRSPHFFGARLTRADTGPDASPDPDTDILAGCGPDSVAHTRAGRGAPRPRHPLGRRECGRTRRRADAARPHPSLARNARRAAEPSRLSALPAPRDDPPRRDVPSAGQSPERGCAPPTLSAFATAALSR
jgi:hypothetical protein